MSNHSGLNTPATLLSKSRTPALALAALGVVYGDIGTSPLYTMKEIFGGAHHPVPMTPENILGILSLIFWSLIIVVTLKYVTFVMRADNRGEGGIMALMALVRNQISGKPYSGALMLLGIFGAALFYGDSVLTPAISVLSAIEGLQLAAPELATMVLPISLGVLLALFFMQKHGTERIGKFFGPIMLLWFLVLGLLGVINIIAAPQVLQALNPHYAWAFFSANPLLGFFSLGASVLALTGGEALYADMGHFGRKPIEVAWLYMVLPALLLNYYGQGALLLMSPESVKNPFYLMAPTWALFPMVVLASAATVIASQAVISGAYSLTRQAIQLGYVPRMDIEHTSRDEIGQIYLPGINWALLIAVALLVIGFGTSSSLAAAYGIAVTGTMVITTILAFFVVRYVWGWSLWLCVGVIGLFLLVDLAYFSANLLKISQGGWLPLVFGLGIFVLMTTWQRGRQLLAQRQSQDMLPLTQFAEFAALDNTTIIPGTAIFMTPDTHRTPHALLHSIKHYKCLHEQIVILTVNTLDVPYVDESERLKIKKLNQQFSIADVFFGFMDETDLPKALAHSGEQGLSLNPMDTSYFLGRETLIPAVGSTMATWREHLFIAMYRNADSAATYFRLPPNRVVELGSQIVM